MKKFRLELLDEKRRPVWNKEIAKTPKPSHAEALDGAEALVVVPIPHSKESGVFRIDAELAKKAGMTLRITSPDLVKKDLKEIFWLKEPLPKLEIPLPNQVFSALARASNARTPADQETIRSYYSSGSPEVRKAEKELVDFSASARQMKPQTTVPIMREIAKPRKTHIQLRGDFLAKDKEVTAGLPTVFPPLQEGEKLNRLGMARWLVSEGNPLTARVVANRYWESLFGQGIVRTSEEFGSQGELPTHPELLDWLATELMRLDWDVKALLKTIVMSATYRQSSKIDSLFTHFRCFHLIQD